MGTDLPDGQGLGAERAIGGLPVRAEKLAADRRGRLRQPRAAGGHGHAVGQPGGRLGGPEPEPVGFGDDRSDGLSELRLGRGRVAFDQAPGHVLLQAQRRRQVGMNVAVDRPGPLQEGPAVGAPLLGQFLAQSDRDGHGQGQAVGGVGLHER